MAALIAVSLLPNFQVHEEFSGLDSVAMCIRLDVRAGAAQGQIPICGAGPRQHGV